MNYQIGEQCYSDTQSAGEAELARFVPHGVTYDFGAGPKAATVFAGGVDQGSCGEWGCEGAQLYFRVVPVGGGAEVEYAVPFFPAPCAIGEAKHEEQAQHIADMNDLWVLVFGALIVIWCVKQVANFFNVNPAE